MLVEKKDTATGDLSSTFDFGGDSEDVLEPHQANVGGVFGRPPSNCGWPFVFSAG